MKDKYLYSRIVLCCLLAVSALACVKEQPTEKIRETTPLTISAGFEGSEVKTYVNKGEIWWNSTTHYLYVFDSKGYKNNFFADCSKGAVAKADFTGEITAGSTVTYVYYSGLAATKDNSYLDTDGKIKGSRITDQNPTNRDSFAASSNIAFMKGGENCLRNILGYIKMTLPIGVKSSRIYSVSVSADENLKGDIEIDLSKDNPSVEILNNENASKSITIKPRWYGKNGVGYDGGDLYLCIPPGTYHNMSFTITPFEANGKEGTLDGGKIGASGSTNTLGTAFTIKAKNDIAVVRGKYTDAGTLPYEDPGAEKDSVLGKSVLLPSISAANAVCLDSDNNILYAGGTGFINVYNVQNPLSAVLLTSVSIKGMARQMKVKDGVLYVTARETGTWLFNVSNPASPSLIKRYDAVELSTGIDVVDNVMFLATRNLGVEFVDVSNISKPEHIRLFSTAESQSVFYSNGYLYSGEWGKGLVTVIDARDLSNIQKVTTFKLQGYGDGVWVKGNRLYASTGHHHLNDTPSTVDGDGHGVEIWDITNPASPSFISRVEFDVFYRSGTDYWYPVLSGDGKTLFCSDVYNGAYVVDLTDETKPKIIARHSLESGNAATSIAVGNGVFFVAEKTNGVRAITCSRAKDPTIDRGTLPKNHNARYDYTNNASKFNAWVPDQRVPVHAASVYSDALLVACGDGGINVIKKNTNGTLYKYAQASTAFTSDLSIKGDRLYAAEGENGLAIYKIGSNFTLSLEERLTDSRLSRSEYSRIAFWVFTPNDKYVVVGSRTNGYQFIAIDNSAAVPTYKWKKSYNNYVAYSRYLAYNVCKGDKLPLISGKILTWINLSSTSEVTIDREDTNFTGGGICAYKDSLALCTSGYMLKIIKAGTSEVVSSTNKYKFIGYPVWDGGNKVALTQFSGGRMWLVDITDFSNPSLKIQETANGKPETALFWDGKMVVPCGYQGLLIQK